MPGATFPDRARWHPLAIARGSVTAFDFWSLLITLQCYVVTEPLAASGCADLLRTYLADHLQAPILTLFLEKSFLQLLLSCQK